MGTPFVSFRKVMSRFYRSANHMTPSQISGSHGWINSGILYYWLLTVYGKSVTDFKQILPSRREIFSNSRPFEPWHNLTDLSWNAVVPYRSVHNPSAASHHLVSADLLIYWWRPASWDGGETLTQCLQYPKDVRKNESTKLGKAISVHTGRDAEPTAQRSAQ